MRELCSKRPSPAMAVALIALFVALGGSGYAAVKVNGKNIKNRSVTAKKLKKNTLTGAEVKDRSLGREDFKRSRLPRGFRGPQGIPGQRGEPGRPGTARAYAIVTPGSDPLTPGDNPSLVPGRSQNVTAVVGPSETFVSGLYCLTLGAGIDPSTTAPVASPEASGTGLVDRDDATVLIDRSSSANCPAGRVAVWTYAGGSTSNNVAFSIVVP